jgi:CRISPR/Cas system-associated endonuclease/helicase Cas3
VLFLFLLFAFCFCFLIFVFRFSFFVFSFSFLKIYDRYTLNDQRTPMPELFAADPTAGRKHKQIDEAGTLFEDVGVQLRDYQVKAVNAALQQHRGIIKCATGGGKTWILAAILKALGGKYVIFVLFCYFIFKIHFCSLY